MLSEALNLAFSSPGLQWPGLDFKIYSQNSFIFRYLEGHSTIANENNYKV